MNNHHHNQEKLFREFGNAQIKIYYLEKHIIELEGQITNLLEVIREARKLEIEFEEFVLKPYEKLMKHPAFLESKVSVLPPKSSK